MKSGRQVIDRALKRIGVVAQDESATAEQYADAKETLDGLFAEINREAPAPWSVDAGVPDYAFNALWRLLAVEIAADYDKPQPEGRGVALARAMGTVRSYVPDDCCCRSYPCKCHMGDYI